MTNFFKQLEPMMGSMELNLIISKTGDVLTVCVMPKAKVSDETIKNLHPIVMSGTADEVDEGFFAHINKPLERTKGLISNIEEYEKDLEERSKQTKAAKAKEDEEKAKKEAEKKALERKNKKVKLLMEKVETLAAEKKYRDAIGAINEAKKVEGATTKLMDKRFKELTTLLTQGQLFGATEDFGKVETSFGDEIDKQIDNEEKSKGKPTKPAVAATPAASSSEESSDGEEKDEDDDEDQD